MQKAFIFGCFKVGKEIKLNELFSGYFVCIGYGHDTIYEDNYYDKNKILFGDEINIDRIEIIKEGYDLILSVVGTDDSIRINEYFYSSYRVV